LVHLDEVRAAYDVVAADYADLLADLHARSPHDRAVLALFAELVLGAGGGPVLDAGCGPGRLTGHLAELGLDVRGVDLSPGMVDVARRAHPGLSFDVGELGALPVPDGALGGLVVWYSLIHVPPEQRPRVLADAARALAPGGQLVLAFQVGNERVRHEQAYGHTVSFDGWRLPVARIAAMLEAAGLAVHTRLVRAAEGRESTPQAYLVARRC
jgi:SAM-dependent methyltransferase